MGLGYTVWDKHIRPEAYDLSPEGFEFGVQVAGPSFHKQEAKFQTFSRSLGLHEYLWPFPVSPK